MPFRKLFGGKQEPSAAANENESTEAEKPDADEPEQEFEGEPEAIADEDHDVGDGAPEEADRIDWLGRARAVLPTGASTGSKRLSALYGNDDSHAPTHFLGSVGCRLADADGHHYYDCTMALGSVALGYAEPNVTRAVQDAAANGNVSGLSDIREIEVAERLCDVIPCAEMVQFLKTGAEGVAAAVRLARTYTARDVVIGSGYFGWLDLTSRSEGVPQGTRSDFVDVPFDDVSALEAAVLAAGSKLAAIVLEPVVEKLPSETWIARARELATSSGAVLVFDEMKTGFRVHTAGYGGYAKVKPDLAVFGKAMANGYPLAAVVGQRDVMLAARKTWISSTLASEATALAAARAVLDWHQEADICESLWSIGRDLRKGVSAAIKASGVSGVSMEGIDPMWFLKWDDPARESRFLELASEHGVLFKRGAYNYAAIAHEDPIIVEIEAMANKALLDLRDEEASR